MVELEAEALAHQEGLDHDAFCRVGNGQALGQGSPPAGEGGRRPGLFVGQRQERIEGGEDLVLRRAQAQAGFVDVGDGPLDAEEFELQVRRLVAEAQVVPEGPVLVLVGEQGIFFFILFDLDDFPPQAGRVILGPRGRQDARECGDGDDSFHMLKL